jgi:hypothetical protein
MGRGARCAVGVEAAAGARGREGLAGPHRENTRNSISPNHPWYGQAEEWRGVAQGEQVLTMNLVVLKKTRRAPEVGDIFIVQPPDGQFLFGRVVDTDANPLGVGGAVLIYIYRVRSAAKTPIPELLRGQLLVPPMMTNKRPWTMGYFERVENRPLSAVDRLRQHCFKDTRGWYFDQAGNRLAGPAEPVGQWGLHSYRTIDDEISEALGIPLSPDE